MITLDTVRAALLSAKPRVRLDELVRAEMAAGQKTKQIYEILVAMSDEIDGTPGLSEIGSEVFGDGLDALSGMCHPDCQYKDPPNTTLPTEDEISKLPRWAQVAFAMRCARRVLPLFLHRWPEALEKYLQKLTWVVVLGEKSAAEAGTGTDWASPAGALTCAAYVCDAVLNAGRDNQRAIEVIIATDTAIAKFKDNAEDVFTPQHIGTIIHVITNNASIAIANGIAQSHETYDPAQVVAQIVIRRDFDHLANLAQLQHWTDDTSVPPDVFGPLWPEGPPKGWPPITGVPQRTELPLAFVARDGTPSQVTEDDVVNLFNTLNRYHIARGGVPLTYEDLRSLLPAHVPAEV